MEALPSDFASWVLSVGATDENDERCDPNDWGSHHGSNYGNGIDVVAPGNNILTINSLHWSGDRVCTYDNGTSMAAPHVSGLAGLIRLKL